jgi:hypothetical protein
MATDVRGSAGDHAERYDGPVTVARGTDNGAPWIWVANGTRLAEDTFAPPRSLAKSAPLVWASVPTDEATVDRVIESFRTEAMELNDLEPVAGDAETSPVESADQTATALNELSSRSFGGRELLGAASIRVLGPVEIKGWRHEPDRAILTELACYLAVHRGRTISGDHLRAALWPDDAKEASAKSLRTYLSSLRKALGPDRIPQGTAAGYAVSDEVVVDWEWFQRLTRPDANVDLHCSGLRLIRGQPFAGVPTNRFGWIYSELLVSEMEVAIVGAAKRSVSLLLDGDHSLETAAWAVEQGQLGVPTDLGLWELKLSVAARRGPDELARASRDARAVLGDDAEGLIAGAS